jgi:hypothetical protein
MVEAGRPASVRAQGSEGASVMNRTAGGTFALTSLAAMALPAALFAQVAFRPAEGDFTVAFPGRPAVVGQVSASGDEAGFRSYVDEEPAARLVVTVDQYPKGIPVPSPSPATYELLLRAHAKDRGFRLVGSRAAELGGRASLEGAFETPDGRRTALRVLMVGPRIYQVEYEAKDKPGDQAAAEMFLNSFRLR